MTVYVSTLSGDGPTEAEESAFQHPPLMYDELRVAIQQTIDHVLSFGELYAECMNIDVQTLSTSGVQDTPVSEMAGSILHMFYLYQDRVYSTPEMRQLLQAVLDTPEEFWITESAKPYPHGWPQHVYDVERSFVRTKIEES